MLILNRKVGEVICIDDNIRIKLLEVSKNYPFAKIGIEAPKDISIHREEVKNRIFKSKTE